MAKTRTKPPKKLETIAIEVIDSGGTSHQATVWPTMLCDDGVTGTVEWNGPPPQFSVIKASGQMLTHFGQRLLLTYAATDESTLPTPGFLGAGKWSKAKLSFQHLPIQPRQMVRVTLCAQDNLASLLVDDEPGLNSILHIPATLQAAPVGLALVEMTSRLLFGYPWLAQDS